MTLVLVSCRLIGGIKLKRCLMMTRDRGACLIPKYTARLLSVAKRRQQLALLAS